jgi:branched-chain amino acid transport system substrate-binding protein
MKRLALLTTLVLIIGGSAIIVRAENDIKIGFAYVFSDRLAHYGYGAKQGAEMAMEEVNQAGGLNGRKLVGIYADDKLKPAVGAEVVTKLIKEDKVDVVMGIVSSAVADAVAPVANQLETPLIVTLAMTPDITGPECNPYTFRISMDGPQNIMGAAHIAAESSATRWTTMGPDYLFGYQSWEYFQRYLRQLKPDVSFAPESEALYAPVTATDFSPYINKLLASKTNGVLVTLYGGNLVDFVRQGVAKQLFDEKKLFLMNLAYSADVMFGLGLDMPKGVWLGGLYWFQSNSSPENLKFVEAYTRKYKIFPDFNAHGGYAGVKAYAAAVKKAGGTDKKKVAKALEGLTIDLPVGLVTIRAGDHQAIMDGVWGVTSEFDGKLRTRLLKPLKIFNGEEITPPLDKTGCHMKQLE